MVVNTIHANLNVNTDTEFRPFVGSNDFGLVTLLGVDGLNLMFSGYGKPDTDAPANIDRLIAALTDLRERTVRELESVAEPITLLFRDRTPEGAAEQAKAWVRSEGMRIRTLGRIDRRDDLPTWGAADDPYVTLHAWSVTVIVAELPAMLPELPALPEAPTLPRWSGA